MKFSKKLVVITVLIMMYCFVPITAVASSSCPSLEFKIQNRQHSVETTNYLYLCGIIENEDGTEEYVYEDYTITTTRDTYESKCKKCDYIIEQLGLGEKRKHSVGSFSE